MRKIPLQLTSAFTGDIRQTGVAASDVNEYLKWLQYYLDFCDKYRHPPRDRDSLPLFLQKLSEKGQNPEKQRQAAESVAHFYETLTKHPELTGNATTGYQGKWEVCLTRLKEEIALRQYSKNTYKTYSLWVRDFAQYLKDKPPEAVEATDAKEYLTYLAVKRKVSASTQNQAFNSLLFLFRHILKVEYQMENEVVRARKTRYIPVVMSRNEVDRVISKLDSPYDLACKVLYGCGLRLFECQNLRVHCFNLDERVLTVHDGKGKKDRTLPLPESLLSEIGEHLEKLHVLHEQDLREGYDGVFMPAALGQKWKSAAKEFPWQWFFPAKTLTFVPEENEKRRYHMHATEFSQQIKWAVRKAKLTKRVTAHTFRHSFASHLLLANYDIRTIQEMMGHSDVRTTMIYTHTVKSRTHKERRSPLDFGRETLGNRYDPDPLVK